MYGVRATLCLLAHFFFTSQSHDFGYKLYKYQGTLQKQSSQICRPSRVALSVVLLPT